MRATCPMCKKALAEPDDARPFRPFCSQRCKLADLGNWLSDAYRISTPLEPGDFDDDEVKPS